MTITYARRQSKASGDNTDPAVMAFDNVVVEGSLLVVSATERAAGSADNFVISDNGSNADWVKRVNETTLQGDTNARRTHVVWTRVATATDAAQVTPRMTISVDDGTANGKLALAEEYEAGAAVTWSFEAVVAANTGTGSTSPLASGDTASTSGTQLLIGNAIWRLGTGGQAGIAFSGLSDLASVVGANNARSVAAAWAQSAATGVKSTEVSWTGTGHEGNVALLVFSATEPGGGGQTVAVGQTAETDTAQVVTRAKELGLLAEIDTAQAVTATKTATLGLAEETDLAQSITAQQGGGGQTVAVGQATETDAAQAFTRARTLGLVSQTDEALAITATKTVIVGLVTETDVAQTVVLPGVVGQATETDLALSITATKTVTLDLATETALAQGFTRAVELALAVETDLALAMTALQTGFADPNPLHHVYREPSGHAVYAETSHDTYNSPAHNIFREGT